MRLDNEMFEELRDMRHRLRLVDEELGRYMQEQSARGEVSSPHALRARNWLLLTITHLDVLMQTVEPEG